MTGRKGLDAAWISHTTWPRGATFVDAERIAHGRLYSIGTERSAQSERSWLSGTFTASLCSSTEAPKVAASCCITCPRGPHPISVEGGKREEVTGRRHEQKDLPRGNPLHLLEGLSGFQDPPHLLRIPPSVWRSPLCIQSRHWQRSV